MGAGRKTLGGPEPCTIQASFRRSATTGAKHHKVVGNTHTNVKSAHTCQKWGMYSEVGASSEIAKSLEVCEQSNFISYLNLLFTRNAKVRTLTGKFFQYSYSVCQLCHPKDLCDTHEVLDNTAVVKSRQMLSLLPLLQALSQCHMKLFCH